MVNFDIKFMILDKNKIYHDISKIIQHKILEIKISVKFIKLTNQMISKFTNYQNQRNQNYQISPLC